MKEIQSRKSIELCANAGFLNITRRMLIVSGGGTVNVVSVVGRAAHDNVVQGRTQSVDKFGNNVADAHVWSSSARCGSCRFALDHFRNLSILVSCRG